MLNPLSWFCAILDYVQESDNGAEFRLVKATVHMSSNLNNLVSKTSVSGVVFSMFFIPCSMC